MDIQSAIALTLISITFILILIHCATHGSKVGRLVDQLPGPRWLPIIGNALDVLIHPEELWHFMRRNARDHYPLYKFWIINWPVINIRHPDDIEVLLSSSKQIEKSLFYDFLHPWLKEGLLTSTGNKWRSRRKILTPAFHLNILHEYCEGTVENADRLVAKLKNEVKSEGVIKELLSMCSSYTLYSICEMAMGMKLDEKDPAQEKYKRSVYEIGEILYYRVVRPWFKSDWIFAMTTKGREQAQALKILHGFSTKIINERKQYHKETGGKYLKEFSASKTTPTVVESVDNNIKRKRLAFLDLLIAASKEGVGLDDSGIREEVDTFVFEGHDTTGMGLFFAILLLAENKECQERARAEVNAVLKDSNGKISMNEISRCVYLEYCVKETLRLYPSVPVISRKIGDDVKLKHCDVAKGTIVNIHIFDVHRDPNFWPRPNIFDPERFLPERIAGRHPFSYIPFSAGPRNCIGQKFAMLVMKSVIAKLLYNFHFEPLESAANVAILPDLVMRSAHPVHVKFVPIVK